MLYHILFIQLYINGHWDCFYLLTIVSNAVNKYLSICFECFWVYT